MKHILIAAIVLPLIMVENSVDGAAPRVNSTNNYFKHGVFRSGDGQNYFMTEFNVFFDQDIFVNFSGSTIKPYSAINGTYGSSNTKWPLITYVAQGVAKLCCDSVCTSMFGKSDGPPMFLIPLPTTVESFPTFFGYLGKFVIDSPVIKNKITFAILNQYVGHEGGQGNGILQDQIDQCASNGTLRIEINQESNCVPDGGVQQTQQDIANVGLWKQSDMLCSYGGIMNQQGERVPAFNATFPAEQLMPECTPEIVEDTLRDYQQIVKSFRSVTSMDGLQALDFVKATLDMRYSIQACQSLLDNMVTFGLQEVTIESSYSCPFEYNTTNWKADPCCNHFDTLCCVPKQITMNLTTIKSISYQNVSSYCPGNEASVYGTLYAALGEQNAADSAETGQLWEQYQSYVDPVGGCLYGLWGQSCSMDSDCYSQECDQDSSQCKVPTNISETFFRCAKANFDIEMFIAIRKVLGVSLAPMDSEDVIDAMVQAMRGKYLTRDCVGRNAWDARATTEWRLDETGNYNQVIIPANETKCLSDQQCNWNWQYDRQQCVNTTGKSEYFCGDCNEGNCWEVSRFPQCELGNTWMHTMDEAACTNVFHGTYAANDWGGGNCLSNTSASDSLSDCLDLSICPGIGSPDQWIKDSFEDSKEHGYYWQCSQPMCYNKVLNQTQCFEATTKANTWKWFDANAANGTGLCVVGWDTYSVDWANWQTICDDYSTDNTNWKLWTGRTYSDGEFNTQQTCEQPACQIPGKGLQPELTENQCKSEFACDQSCPACVSDDNYCITSHKNETTCSNNNGKWKRVNGTNQYGCVVSLGYKKCVANGWKSINCSIRADRDTCHDYSLDYSELLNCHWSTWEPCPTIQDCEAKGTCDDWEFTDWSKCESKLNNVTNEYEMQCPGRCLVPFKTLPNGAKLLSCNVPLDHDGYPDWDKESHDSNWEHSRMGCVSSTIADALSCLAINGTWVKRASTQQECTAHGMGCKTRWRGEASPFNMSGSDCANCDGKPQSLYTWTKGQQKQGKMQQFQWLPRRYSSVNSMSDVVPYYAFQQVADAAIVQVLARSEKNKFEKEYNLKFGVFQKLAKFCSIQEDNGDNSNSEGNLILTSDGECSCVEGTCSGSCKITCGDDDECDYSGSSASAASVADWSSATSRRLNRRSMAESTSTVYEVIYDYAGNLVGQLIGNGYKLNGTLPETYKLCLSVDATIVQNANYTVYDFAMGTSPGVPLNLNITVVGDTICANVSGDSLHWPIKRLRNDQIVWTSSPTSTPTSAPSESPTGAPTAPTAAPSFTPTDEPTQSPIAAPTLVPSMAPLAAPSIAPSQAPSENNSTAGATCHRQALKTSFGFNFVILVHVLTFIAIGFNQV